MNPVKLTVDAIIEYQGGYVLIERTKPPLGWALPGGKLEEGETLEEAVLREVREETGLHLLGARQFRTYSDPGRDPRGRYISTVFIARGAGQPSAGSDAKRIAVFTREQIDAMRDLIAFDHYRILRDYWASRESVSGSRTLFAYASGSRTQSP